MIEIPPKRRRRRVSISKGFGAVAPNRLGWTIELYRRAGDIDASTTYIVMRDSVIVAHTTDRWMAEAIIAAWEEA